MTASSESNRLAELFNLRSVLSLSLLVVIVLLSLLLLLRTLFSLVLLIDVWLVYRLDKTYYTTVQ
jgi:hypothetical protein